MKCKACKNEVPDGSIFCNHCGEKLVKTKKQEVSVPKPRQLKNGDWYAQMMIKGETYYVTAATEKEYFAKARAIKSGMIEQKKTRAGISLRRICLDFIESRRSVLSPSTISGYEGIVRTRFLDYMDKDYLQINWQAMINTEAARCSPKTLKNAWGFICTVLSAQDMDKPKVRLPQLVAKELPWLTPEQLPLFLKAVKGKPCELAALFALHSLRKSEFIALTPENIKDGFIHVEGARVRNGHNELVYKETTKNASSRRKVKIRIPRLKQLLAEVDTKPGEYYITMSTNDLHTAINRVCDSVGLPHVGCHGLRRSYASLAYFLDIGERETMRDGGWSDYHTMHKKYIKLAEADADAPDAMDEFYASLENS